MTLLEKLNDLAVAADEQADRTTALLATGENAHGERMTHEQEETARMIVSYQRGLARGYRDSMVYVSRDIEDFNAAAISYALRQQGETT